jgi:hypothetical protein
MGGPPMSSLDKKELPMRHRHDTLALTALLLAPLALRADDKTPSAVFYGVESKNAGTVVFVIDHSGNFIDTFDFLREEIKTSITKLDKDQNFAAIFFSENVDQVFPSKGDPTASATDETKKEFADFVDKIRPAGLHEDPVIFADALKKAISLKPAAIYFVTAGRLGGCNFADSPDLAKQIQALSKDAKIPIHTIAYFSTSKEGEATLKQIAADSGGQFKFVTEKDLSN